MTTAPRPLICVSANYRQAEDRRLPSYFTAERYVQSLLRMVDCIPVLMPPAGGAVDAVELVSRMDGFLLTGGLANVEPHRYDAPAFPSDEPIDPGRDALVLPLFWRRSRSDHRMSLSLRNFVPVVGRISRLARQLLTRNRRSR